ncbi:hypothetical protein B5S33_g482 [[Candida] boidinii]|nr:hypothetical protein B5S33_g482 [[Candida] boidinii]
MPQYDELPSIYSDHGLSASDQKKVITTSPIKNRYTNSYDDEYRVKNSTKTNKPRKEVNSSNRSNEVKGISEEYHHHPSEDIEMIDIDNLDTVTAISKLISDQRQTVVEDLTDGDYNSTYNKISRQSGSRHRKSMSSASPSPPAETFTSSLPSIKSLSKKLIYLVVDTNFIISHLSLLVELRSLHDKYDNIFRIVIPKTVIDELDGLKNVQSSTEYIKGTHYSLASLSRSAIDWIFKNLQKSDEIVKGQKLSERLDRSSVKDDAILDCCLYLKSKNPNNLIILLSNDKNFCIKALTNDILTISFQENMTAKLIADTIVQENNMKSSERIKRDNLLSSSSDTNDNINDNGNNNNNTAIANTIDKSDPFPIITSNDPFDLDSNSNNFDSWYDDDDEFEAMLMDHQSGKLNSSGSNAASSDPPSTIEREEERNVQKFTHFQPHNKNHSNYNNHNDHNNHNSHNNHNNYNNHNDHYNHMNRNNHHSDNRDRFVNKLRTPPSSSSHSIDTNPLAQALARFSNNKAEPKDEEPSYNHTNNRSNNNNGYNNNNNNHNHDRNSDNNSRHSSQRNNNIPSSPVHKSNERFEKSKNSSSSSKPKNNKTHEETKASSLFKTGDEIYNQVYALAKGAITHVLNEEFGDDIGMIDYHESDINSLNDVCNALVRYDVSCFGDYFRGESVNSTKILKRKQGTQQYRLKPSNIDSLKEFYEFWVATLTSLYSKRDKKQKDSLKQISQYWEKLIENAEK